MNIPGLGEILGRIGLPDSYESVNSIPMDELLPGDSIIAKNPGRIERSEYPSRLSGAVTIYSIVDVEGLLVSGVTYRPDLPYNNGRFHIPFEPIRNQEPDELFEVGALTGGDYSHTNDIIDITRSTIHDIFDNNPEGARTTPAPNRLYFQPFSARHPAWIKREKQLFNRDFRRP